MNDDVNAAMTPVTPVTPETPVAPAVPVMNSVDELSKKILEAQVIETLRTVYDPEIPVNIHELGMIYNVAISPPANVVVTMTLTSPMCPVAGTLPGEVQEKLKSIPSVQDVKVELVWEPPWNPSMMTEAARLELGMM